MISQQQNIDLALQIFLYAGKSHSGFTHNYDTYHSILFKLSRARAFDPVESLLADLRNSYPPITCGENLFIDLLRNYGLAGRFQSSARIFLRILDFGVKRSVRSLNTLLNVLIQNQRFDLVHSFYKNSKESFGITPNILPFAVKFDALCEDHKVDEACHLWKKMLKNNCMPDNALLSTLIHWLCKEGRVSEARRLFDEFEKGSIPSLLTYNTLISGMCEKGELTEAGRLWDDMVERKCKPNAFTYNVLIEGLSKNGNVKEGVRVLEELLENGCFPNKITFLILFEGLQKSGKEEEAIQIVSIAVMSGKVDKESWELFVKKFTGELDKGVLLLKELLHEISAS